MNASTTGLLTQLRALLTLTNTEIQVAQTRTAQARTEAIRKELTENANNARVRVVAIDQAIRGLGGLPDLIRPLVGRTAALGKTFIEQAQPLDEALLGDLALEHQLLDRSRYVKGLATSAQRSDLVALADRLIAAHTATVEWLTIVIAEEALGGPVALRRTPVQWASGVAARAATVPGVLAARGADRVIDTARQAPRLLSNVRSGARDVADVAATTVIDGGAKALETAEAIVRDAGSAGLASSVHDVREIAGTIDADELPISDYDELNVTATVGEIKELESPHDIRLIVAYEEAHKNRSGVVSAAQARLADIAKDVVGLS